MAFIKLNKQLSTDEILKILKNGYPNYVFVKNNNNIIIFDTGADGKFIITISGDRVLITRDVHKLIAISVFFTIVFIPLFINENKRLDKLIGLPMGKYLHEKCNSTIIKTENNNQNIIIPDTCPHCKNPNTKKISLCEWCGNQIT